MHRETDETWGDEKLPFLCECGDAGCARCVPLTVAEYRELPYRPPWLVLAPGHTLKRRSASRQADR